MSELKATPGPWRVGTHGPNGCYTIGTQQGLMTAMVAHSVSVPSQKEQAVGNAHLIAAAPELYRLLAKVEHVFTLSEQGKPLPDDRDGQEWLDETRLVLAKARGEQP